jgi:hypothetical protein
MSTSTHLIKEGSRYAALIPHASCLLLGLAISMSTTATLRSAFNYRPRPLIPSRLLTQQTARTILRRGFVTTTLLPSTVRTHDRLSRLQHSSRLATTSISTAFVRHCSHRRMCLREDVSGSAAMPKREVLPKNVKPIHYNLTLEPELEKFTYVGDVTIEFEPYSHHMTRTQLTLDQSRGQGRHNLDPAEHQ